MNAARKPSLLLSLIPMIFLIVLLSLNVMVFGDGATAGPNQIALLSCALLAGLLCYFNLNMSYKNIEKSAVKAIAVSMQANLILLVVGSLIGTWIVCGVVPTMIYYGVTIVNPSLFLPVTCIICGVVSLATGSSWSTGGTVGIALMGIGKTLNIPDEMTAGAIISGSYFGDKLSPLSDTTNLAPAIAGTDLFTHVKHMMKTVFFSMGGAVIGFFLLGLSYQNQALDMASIDAVRAAISGQFWIHPVLLLIPVAVIIMVSKKVPALPALIFGAIIAAIFALVFQKELIAKVLEGQFTFTGAYKYLLKVAYAGFESSTGNAVIDKLFSRGGMSSMLNTVWLIITAMSFGGIMEGSGMLATIANQILRMVRGVSSLVAATLSSSIFLNITASDQYLAIVVTAKMFKQAYHDYGLHPKNLSRAVEDGATVTSVLVPWNTCGAYFSSVLGVATGAYLPFCFFNLLSPAVSLIVASTGWSMDKLDPNDSFEADLEHV
jgi:NhaC family Na+:H+ antiporter